jgi:hypothetical protein
LRLSTGSFGAIPLQEIKSHTNKATSQHEINPYMQHVPKLDLRYLNERPAAEKESKSVSSG